MNVRRFGAFAACALVAAGLVTGFALTGSPQHARTEAMDTRRVEDIESIAERVNARFGTSTVGSRPLPASLPRDVSALRPDGSAATRDPVSGKPYRYVRENARQYRLCADFDLMHAPQRYEPGQHPAGHACYRFDAGDVAVRIGAAVPDR